MKSKVIARWGLVVAIGLVGCTVGVPNVADTPKVSSGDAGLDAMEQPAHQGNLVMRIQWPARPLATQAIPLEAETIEVSVRSKSNQLLVSKTIDRPAGESPVSTFSFQISPAHETVNVEVVVRGGGKILAQGGQADVPIRDNTSTGVVITLDNEASLTIRISRQITLLKDLYHYADRFDNWVNPRTFPEVLTMEAAVRQVVDSFNSNGQHLFHAMSLGANGTLIEGAPGTVETWHLPGQSILGLELRDRAILKAFWPGYQISQAFTSGPLQRRLDLALNPSSPSGDQTRATLSADVTSSWVAEPQLRGSFAGVNPQSETTGARAFDLFGGERPVPETISALRLSGEIVPQGQVASRFKAALELNEVRETATSPLLAAIRDANPNGYVYFPYAYYGVAVNSLTRFPTKGEASLEFPSLHAALSAALNPDFTSGSVTLRLAPRDKAGVRSVFLAKADASVRIEKVGERSMITGGVLSFVLDDEMENLRLEGTVTLDSEPLRLVVEARFVDIPSRTVIGRIDYDAPFDERGGLNVSKNETWPYLVLMDGAGGTPGTRIHLTPGLFTNRTSGGLNVYIY